MLIWLFYYCNQQRLARDRSAPVLFIKYEDLVCQPVHELTRVTDFLGLQFEDQVALGCGNTDGVLDWEYGWKGRALEPIAADRIESWRTELLPEELDLLENLGGHALRQLGYALVNPRPNRWRTIRDGHLLLELLRFFRRAPWDETANQLFGRAICFH